VFRGFPPWLLDSTHRRRYTRPGIESGHCMSPPPKGRTLRRRCELRLLECQEVARAPAKKIADLAINAYVMFVNSVIELKMLEYFFKKYRIISLKVKKIACKLRCK